MSIITFGIIGGGWRAEFYLRIARALPDRFRVHAMLVRDQEKGRAIEAEWGVRTVRTIEQFTSEAERFGFAVLSVPRTAAPELIRELAGREVPVLAETPPAADLEALAALYRSLPKAAKIQVAEQYIYQPMHAARIQIARSGLLGDVSHVQVSAAHDYHGISLIRHLLGAGFEPAVISGQRFASTIMKGPDRQGDPKEEALIGTDQQLATLRFGDKLAVYDFTRDQYFSWIRRSRILVRGSKGEIVDAQLSYLKRFDTPIHTELRRIDTGHNGNLEGYYHRGIAADGDWLYRNPVAPASLSDDEIAIATSLLNMGAYAAGSGPSFYSLAEAAQDHYLALMMGRAIETGQTVTAERQVWASE
ncbi:Gfo/Idh/MocA family oxidoreductase [Paenibacillus arenilitoris]|uniref:Gfo/Idh/MocA family oxidoreductase n=1 Tax=Paenibacillus arenilitoris TaxID=2772299 RepID=A0A927CSF2_9BACL|nr:Gfo/Idh/MocA family oxidoreductase [Paenibacillus arenilitoris]MBD2872347.1 Gfo/Idh/MocA family oxidoreductase [Paenibacillus arenilitoris]